MTIRKLICVHVVDSGGPILASSGRLARCPRHSELSQPSGRSYLTAAATHHRPSLSCRILTAVSAQQRQQQQKLKSQLCFSHSRNYFNYCYSNNDSWILLTKINNNNRRQIVDLSRHHQHGNGYYYLNGQFRTAAAPHRPLYSCDQDQFQRRHIHLTSIHREAKDSSKVETTVKALKKEKDKSENSNAAAAAGTLDATKVPESTKTTPASASSVESLSPPPPTTSAPPTVTVVAKRPLLKRIWDEIVHYYHGFRLLFIDIRIATKMGWRVLGGDDLSRREHRQLVRTVSDVFRLVPFSVFIIVPFMEFLLPVFLKFFPGMLPSTFESSKDKDAKVKTQLKLKLEVAKFLQNTLDEMALQAKGESHSANAKEFAQFFDKIRRSGQQATNAQIIKFSGLFEDEITLDSLSRPQLVALCRLLELKPIGTNNFLQFQLRMKLRSLRADDVMIRREGVDSLTVPELQSACRARGMRAIGVSEDRLRSQLDQWLELSLSENIPPSLLLLSRVLYLPETVTQADSLKATIESLPDEVKTEARYKIGETEGKIDNKTKIEIIRKEEEAIERERQERAREEAEEILNQRADILIDKAKEIGEQGLAARLQEPGWTREDLESIEVALDSVAAEKSKLLVEKEEFEELKEEMREYKEDIEEFKEIATTTDTHLKESKAAERLRKRVDKMITRMDNVFENLEHQKAAAHERMEEKMTITSETASSPDERGDKEAATTSDDLEKDKKDVIAINELLLSIKRLQKVPDDTKLQRIVDVLDAMDVDHDGNIEIEHVIRVLDLLGRENVKVDSQQMKELIHLLVREEKIEDEEKKRKQQENNANNNGKNNNNSLKESKTTPTSDKQDKDLRGSTIDGQAVTPPPPSSGQKDVQQQKQR